MSKEKYHKRNQVNRDFFLSSLSVDNKTTVFIITFMIILFGFIAYRGMPKEMFPEIVMPQIYVGVAYPGNSPVDMENLVSRPIEKEINTINGIKEITSTNIQGYTTIIAEFNTDVEIPKALSDVKDAVDKSKKDLPSDLPSDPNVFELDISEMPIMYVNISGDYSLDELEEYAEFLKEEMEALSEISGVDIAGLPEKEVEIAVDLYKMQSREISFSDIENAISSENVTVSAGNILTNGFRRAIRVAGEFEDVDQMKRVIIKDENQDVVFLEDIAEVNFDEQDADSYSRLNTLPVVTLNVKKRTGGNLIDASDKIGIIINEAKENRFPSDLHIDITNDQSSMTRMQLNNLENSIILGVLLVVIVLLFFLGFRNSLFVGVAIPLSMLTGFLVLSLMGISINMVVLFGLILALGMLVDNGIVVVENIYRLLQEGHSPKQAAKLGVGEVAWPIIASTATTLAAFVPLAFWGGLMGEFMKYLPITLIIVLASSLFVALVINPVLTASFMRVTKPSKSVKLKRLLIILAVTVGIGLAAHFLEVKLLRNICLFVVAIALIDSILIKRAAHWFQYSFLPFLDKVYFKTVKFALKGVAPYFFLGGTILLLIFSIVLTVVSQPKVSLFPNNEPQYINVYVELPVGTDIKKTNDFTKNVEATIFEVLEPHMDVVESVVAQVGKGTSDPSAGPQQGSSPNKARVAVQFVDFEERTDISTNGIMENVRAAMANVAGATITVEKNQMGPPTGKPISVEISGEEIDTLLNIAEHVSGLINNSGIRGIEELKTDVNTNKPELLVDIDREAAGRYGVSTGQIASAIRTALFGKEIAKFKQGEDKYPIHLRLKEDYRYSEQSLLEQKITFRDPASGKINQVPISAVATDHSSTTYDAIKRKDLKRVVTLYSNVKEGYNDNEIIVALKDLLENEELQEGYEISFTGKQEEQAESSAFLMRALLIAMFLIFLIIVTQFNSISTPFIIMLSVLFSTIGVFLGLTIFRMDFIIMMTGVGIISLAGVVVNNAIVLIDYINLTRDRKRNELKITDDERLPVEEVRNAIIKGGETRLRPVLLTAITTVLGLIPLAIGLNLNFATLFTDLDPQVYTGGDSAAFWGPMAWTVIFGLIFATFLTLVIVPVMYMIAERIKWGLIGNRKVAKIEKQSQLKPRIT